MENHIKNTIVLKPSIGQDNLPQYASTLQNKIAEGFAANPDNVLKMTKVI
jgi:hypothetical protein